MSTKESLQQFWPSGRPYALTRCNHLRISSAATAFLLSESIEGAIPSAGGRYAQGVPALATAATSSARPTHCIPRRDRGRPVQLSAGPRTTGREPGGVTSRTPRPWLGRKTSMGGRDADLERRRQVPPGAAAGENTDNGGEHRPRIQRRPAAPAGRGRTAGSSGSRNSHNASGTNWEDSASTATGIVPHNHLVHKRHAL